MAQDAEPAPKKLGRLTKPWRDMPSLTDEQKLAIREIHGDVVEQIKAIQAKEREDILALLSDEQKAELAEMESAKKGEAASAPATPAMPAQ